MYPESDMSDNIRFGIHVGTEGWNFEKVKNFCIEAETLGFDFFTDMDHLMNQWDPQGEGPLECWTTLAGLPAVTNKIKLGPLVSCYGYHRPTMLAKMATTIDIISNGRLIFGLGAGWHETEFKGFTGRFPSTRERMRGLEESLEICKSMFSNEWTTYHGRIYEVDNVQNKPQPVQRHIPIMVGGAGEKRTLRIAAKHADISHFLSQGSIEENARALFITLQPRRGVWSGGAAGSGYVLQLEGRVLTTYPSPVTQCALFDDFILTLRVRSYCLYAGASLFFDVMSESCNLKALPSPTFNI